tara:strand:+ start:317 stop:1015 length:699 start_codon:yes stop_codon:yes gene_type:complete
MAKQAINIGSSANDGAGDPLRTAFTKINENFVEVYTELGGSSLSNISFTGNTIGTDDTNGNILLSPNGTGAIVIDTSKNLQFTSHTDNAILKFDASGNVAISSIVDNGTTVVMGDITVNGTTSTLTTTTNDINLVPGGGEVNVTGHILSDTTNTKDLGTSANAWRSIFGTKLTATGDRINISTVHTPTTNAGASGDLIGDISADASYIYYCTATWVSPGSAAIWKRVAIATW